MSDSTTTNMIPVPEKKARAPRRTDAEIAADYERKAAEAKQRAKLRGTPGLKALIDAQVLLSDAHKAIPDGASHKARVFTVLQSITGIVNELQK